MKTSIFALTHYTTYKNQLTTRMSRMAKLGLFTSLETAENEMLAYIKRFNARKSSKDRNTLHDDELYAFMVKEHECDQTAHENQFNVLSERLYSASGELLDVRMSSRKMKNANTSCRFQVGDIVEILQINSSEISLSNGIITRIPKNLVEPIECIVYSEYNDDEPFYEDEVFSTNMMKPTEPVDKDLCDALKENMQKFVFKQQKSTELIEEYDEFEDDHDHWEEKLFDNNDVLDLSERTKKLIKNECNVLYMPWYDLLTDVEDWDDVIDNIEKKRIYEGKIIKVWINQDSKSLIESIKEFESALKQNFEDFTVGIDNDLKFGSVKILCVKCDKEYIG